MLVIFIVKLFSIGVKILTPPIIANKYCKINKILLL
jgi:hypothetical protein